MDSVPKETVDAGKPKGFWREQWFNILTLLVLGIFGLIEQRSEGKFRIFMLPGWPTYAIAWVLFIFALVITYSQRRREQV